MVFVYSVLIISSVIFSIALIYVGLSVYFTRNYTDKEPPTMNACPDYWEIDANGSCIIPTDGKNLGSIDIELTPNMSYVKPNGYTEVNLNVPTLLKTSTIYNCTGVPILDNSNNKNIINSSSLLTYTGIAANGAYTKNDMNQCYYTGNPLTYDKNMMICKYTMKYNIPDNVNSNYSLNIQQTMNPNDRIWSRLGSPICTQHTWARSNNIEWEGISNYNKC